MLGMKVVILVWDKKQSMKIFIETLVSTDSLFYPSYDSKNKV